MIRFIFIYTVVQILWYYFYLYYHSLLINAVIEVARKITFLPPILPELTDNNAIYLRVGRIVFLPVLSYFNNTTPLFISLMLSSSGIQLIPKMKMIFYGTTFLFITQVLSVYYQLYKWFFRYYQKMLRAGVKVNEFLDYNPGRADYFMNTIHYQMVCHYILPLCVWMIMVYYLKRRVDSNFPTILL